MAKAKPKKSPAKAKPAKAKPAKAKVILAKVKKAPPSPSKKGIKSVFKALKAFVTPKKAVVPTAKDKTPASKVKVAPVAAPKVEAAPKPTGDVLGLKAKTGQVVLGGVAALKVPAKTLLKLIAIPIPDEVRGLSPKAPVVDHSEDVTPRATHQSDLFTQSEMTAFLSTLQAERQSLLNKARAAVEGGNIALDKDEMYDEVDLASATVDQNLTFRLLDRDRKLLGEIDHAIQKIETGEFGYCEGTYEPIPKRRLELRPWCRHSVKYKEQLEKLEKSGRGLVDEDAELLD